jgi:DNA-binding LacI/PurR family transcriptional regulator
MPTIKDVAREAGVSIATVSYVLNKKHAYVSEQTRQEVLEAIERIGYAPNATARNLKASRTRLIGYAWHEAPHNQVNSILDRFIYDLARAAEAVGYHLLTFTFPADNPTPVYDELIRTQRVDAFVLADTVGYDERIRFLIEAEFPFVSFGRSNPEWDFPWVDTDGRQGVRDAVDYLISLGHRRIAMAAWPEESLAGGFRVQGYYESLEAAGIPLNPHYLIRGSHSEQAGREAMSYWCQLPHDEQPTAIMGISDLVSIGIMNEVEARGLIVGKDISVIGFDDAPLVQYLRPSLSTIQQLIPEISRAIIQMLEAILDRRSPQQRHLLVPPRLIMRGSCAPPR